MGVLDQYDHLQEEQRRQHEALSHLSSSSEPHDSSLFKSDIDANLRGSFNDILSPYFSYNSDTIDNNAGNLQQHTIESKMKKNKSGLLFFYILFIMCFCHIMYAVEYIQNVPSNDYISGFYYKRSKSSQNLNIT